MEKQPDFEQVQASYKWNSEKERKGNQDNLLSQIAELIREVNILQNDLDNAQN